MARYKDARRSLYTHQLSAIYDIISRDHSSFHSTYQYILEQKISYYPRYYIFSDLRKSLFLRDVAN